MGINVLTMGYDPCFSVTSVFAILESQVGKFQKQRIRESCQCEESGLIRDTFTVKPGPLPCKDSF